MARLPAANAGAMAGKRPGHNSRSVMPVPMTDRDHPVLLRRPRCLVAVGSPPSRRGRRAGGAASHPGPCPPPVLSGPWSAAPTAPEIDAGLGPAASARSVCAGRPVPSPDSTAVPAAWAHMLARDHAGHWLPTGSNAARTPTAPWRPGSASTARPAPPGSPLPSASPPDWPPHLNELRPWPAAAPLWVSAPPSWHSCVTPFHRREGIPQLLQARIQWRTAWPRRFLEAGLRLRRDHTLRAERFGQGQLGARSDTRRRQVDLLPSVGMRQDHALALRMHAKRLAAGLPRQIERRLRQSMPCQLQGVGLHPRLQRPPHFRRRSEEPIRRHQALDPLMRALEVVIIDKVSDPQPGIPQVHEHGAVHTLAPQGAPKAFDLPQRLRPTRLGHDLLDPVLLALAAKLALPTPGYIFGAVSGGDLPGYAIGRQCRP